MFCSTIIPTVGRATLSRAVDSVLAQQFLQDNFEVIVVNDSGKPLPEAAWQHSERVRMITTHRYERCVARNSGAAIARGKYLHFLDDDDWLLPGALQTLWELGSIREAAWLYGSSQLVDRNDTPIIELHHEMDGNCFTQLMAGEWIPLQASLLRTADFFAIGGFHPLMAGAEDIDLTRRLALHGEVAGVRKLVAAIGMGVEKSTTDYHKGVTISRQARERIVDQPGVWRRMHQSAGNSYWYGRIVRIYLTSMVWNLQHRRAFTAASRAAFAMASLVTAVPSLFSPAFWRAVTSKYESATFIQGFQNAGRPVERRKPQNLKKESGDTLQKSKG